MDLIQNEDYATDSCAKSPMTFLFCNAFILLGIVTTLLTGQTALYGVD